MTCFCWQMSRTHTAELSHTHTDTNTRISSDDEMAYPFLGGRYDDGIRKEVSCLLLLYRHDISHSYCHLQNQKVALSLFLLREVDRKTKFQVGTLEPAH